MAEKKTKETGERVDIHIPRAASNEDPNLFVSVNGMNFLLPKGKTSSVPKFVAEEVERAKRAQAALDEKIDMMLAAAQQ